MNVDVRTSAVIARPRQVVSAFAANPDNAPLWYRNIKTVSWKTERPLAVGSRIAFVAQFLGRRLEYTYEVVVWKPDEQFVMQTVDGPFPMETTYTFHKISGNLTRMTLRNRGTPSGFSKLFSPFMSMMMKKANNNDLKSIKRLLEQ